MIIQALTIRRICSALCALGFLVLAAGCSRGTGTDASRGVTANDAVEEEGPGSFGVYHALVIGIDEYQNWPNLRFAERDSHRIADVLQSKYGFDAQHVTRLMGDEATRQTVLNTLRNKLGAMTERDNLLIYYAGHGQLDSITEKGYWVPVDGKLDDVTSWIPFSDLTELLSATKVKAKNVVLLTDSCYGGAMRAGKSPGLPEPNAEQMERYYADLAKRAAKRSRQVAASGGYEQVPDESMFASLLANALEENEYRAVSLEWVFFTIYPHIKLYGQQEPAFGRVLSGPDVDGQFVLVRSGPAVAPAAVLAKLAVRTSTGDGRVLIDGKERGDVPLDAELPPGSHTVVVDKQGHVRFEQQVALAAGEQRTLTVDLVREQIAGPRIETFDVSPSAITKGEMITVSWATADASSVNITDIGAVLQSGSRQIQPSASAEYKIEATNSRGERVVAARSVSVRAQLPVIEFFDAAPDTISAGEGTGLAWRVLGSASVRLAGADGTKQEVAAHGEMQVSPPATTKYMLIAYNTDGARVGKQVTINVTPPATPIDMMGPLEEGISYSQGDISSRPASTAADCARMCNADSKCLAMTFIISQQTCWIKDRVNPAQKSQDMISARKQTRPGSAVVRDHRRDASVVVRDHRTGVVSPQLTRSGVVLNPNTCKQGYVWREAYSGDVVCVTPAVRTQAAADNAQAAARWTQGAHGPHTCIGGYVWREARNGDDVCVLPRTRDQARTDNTQAAARRIGR